MPRCAPGATARNSLAELRCWSDTAYRPFCPQTATDQISMWEEKPMTTRTSGDTTPRPAARGAEAALPQGNAPFTTVMAGRVTGLKIPACVGDSWRPTMAIVTAHGGVSAASGTLDSLINDRAREIGEHRDTWRHRAPEARSKGALMARALCSRRERPGRHREEHYLAQEYQALVEALELRGARPCPGDGNHMTPIRAQVCHGCAPFGVPDHAITAIPLFGSLSQSK